jgi:hypothetical protein
VPVPTPNRWHPVMLPDDYIRKMKQDLAEVEAQVESKTRYEPDPASPLLPETAADCLGPSRIALAGRI